MKFWLNKDLITNNVLILAKNGFLIADCKEEHIDAVAQKLNSGKLSPLDIFPKDDITKVAFRDLTKIESRNTDCDLVVYYRPGSEEKDVDYTFEDDLGRKQCLAILERLLPDHLKKSVSQQGAIIAVLPPILSLLLALFASWLYFDIFRWLTLTCGGLWVVASLYIAYQRFSTPPEVTRWTLKGRYISRLWNKIKTWTSYAAAMVFVIAWSFVFPESYGPRAILEHLESDELKVEDIAELVDNGGELNYQSSDGSSPLHLAIDWEYNQLIPELIAHGADTLMLNAYDQTPIMLAISNGNEEAVRHILDSEKPIGSLKTATALVIYAQFPLELIDSLRKRGLDIHEIDENKDNSLKLAIYDGASKKLIEGLLERGVSSDFDFDGQSIPDYLEEIARDDLLDLFSISELESRSQLKQL